MELQFQRGPIEHALHAEQWNAEQHILRNDLRGRPRRHDGCCAHPGAVIGDPPCYRSRRHRRQALATTPLDAISRSYHCTGARRNATSTSHDMASRSCEGINDRHALVLHERRQLLVMRLDRGFDVADPVHQAQGGLQNSWSSSTKTSHPAARSATRRSDAGLDRGVLVMSAPLA